MAGKNKLERASRILWDDSGAAARDLTGDLVPGSLSGGGLELDEVDLTGVSQVAEQVLGGHGRSEISAQFYLNDTATTGALTVLKASLGLVGTLTLQWGSSGAAPTTGDPEWEGEYTLLSANIVLAGNKPVIQARWKPGSSTAPAWGTVA